MKEILTKIQLQTCDSVLMVKRFTLKHMLLLIGPNEKNRQEARDELARLVKDGYLSCNGEFYSLTIDIDMRFDLLDQVRIAGNHHWGWGLSCSKSA